jgi:membrane protease YdiL (CAAX protease family)
MAVLASLLMVFVTQIIIPLGVLVVLLIGRLAVASNVQGDLEKLGTEAGVKQFQSETMMPLLVTGHGAMIFVGWLVLRLMVGRDWRRVVALRFPSIPHTLLLLLGFPALPFVASGVYLLAQRLIPGLVDFPALLFSQVAMVAVFGFIWLLAYLATGHDCKRDLAQSPLRVQWLAGLAVVAVGLAVAGGALRLVAGIFPQFTLLAPMDQAMGELVKDVRGWHPLLAVLVIGGLPAFSEEFWCRAFLGRGLLGQYGVVVGIIITSYFFGAIHLLPHQGAMAMVMGLMLHYTYVTTRSLVAPMLLHFLNNSISVLGSYLPSEFEKVDSQPEAISHWVLIAGVLLLLAVGWALYRSRARLVRQYGHPFPPWQPPYPGVALPPPDGGMMVADTWAGWLPYGLVALTFAGFAVAVVSTHALG